MTCYQPNNLPGGVTTTGRTGYATEADCLAACKEGACCEGTTCSVKPQCQCQGAGKVFQGVGTVCTPQTCCVSCSFGSHCRPPACIPTFVTVSYSLSMPKVYNSAVTSYVAGFSVSGVATLVLQPQSISGPVGFCGQYLFQANGAAAHPLGGYFVQILGERGTCSITIRRGFTKVYEREDTDCRPGDNKQFVNEGITSAEAVASGQFAGVEVFNENSIPGHAFYGGETSGVCYRTGTTPLLTTYATSHCIPGFPISIPLPVPLVVNEPIGTLQVLDAY